MSQSDRRQTVTRLNCTVLSYFIDSRLFTSYSAFTEFPGSRNRVALTAADQMILPKRKRIIRENNKSEPIPIRPVKSSVILLSIIGDSNIPVNLISMDLPCLCVWVMLKMFTVYVPFIRPFLNTVVVPVVVGGVQGLLLGNV